MGGKIVVLSNRQDWRPLGRDVVIGIENADGSLAIVEGPLTLTTQPEHSLIVKPTFTGAAGEEFLQAALDHAWLVGMRPKNWRVETTEQVAAMAAHLADMRRLVFGRDEDIAVQQPTTGKATAS